MSRRLYTLTRVRAGDYLVPSNDGSTIWRVNAYDEDGSAEDWTGRKVVGRFWMVSRYVGPELRDGRIPEDFLEWTYWETRDSGLATRRAALAVAFPEV